MLQLVLIIIVSSLINQCVGSVSPGRCPYIEPIENFDMKKVQLNSFGEKLISMILIVKFLFVEKKTSFLVDGM